MAKKKIIKQNELKDCSKCNSVREINNELHCSLNMKDEQTFDSYSKVTFKPCAWFKPKVIKVGITNEA
ncbi:hypothetical protein N5T63_09395 [Aliarcobacter cryaerophilus]|uniref:hypothetical protein n=1 Tax=Aliarcobacter cryaerophilus TaxID=28198 RepID=UPI0021B6B770|nr:hypothetical protein [Aliarcobacter cryaerophilus]MCT7489111.1 hypothetical protein [Aliarcobacter cryaerophilus]